MAERTVKVKLVADVSDYTAGLVKAAAATRGLGGEIEKNIDRDMGPSMRRAGEKSGGLLSRGINNGIMRNSPLIVAGVSAALAAGAPAVLASATVLFAGVGAVAASQSSNVREAWTDTWGDIRDGAVEDAAVLGPTFERMADQIGAAFQRMRPEIRDAFEAAAPLIDDFTASLTQAAENAMPGLLRAIERGGPVIEGLGSLMESVGTGLSNFLDAMSDNSGAAGAALAALGDILEQALPLLGELLGTGAEVAADVLPGLAAAIGVVADVAKLLGPLLPPIVLGFAGFKVASAAAGYMQTFAVQAQYATMAMTGSATAGTKVGGALSGMAKALPGIGIALAGVGAIFGRLNAQSDQWAQALLDGGRAAETARAQMSDFTTAMETTNSGFEGFIVNMLGLGTPTATTAIALDQASQKTRELYEAMSPLDQRTQDITRAQNDLELAVGRYGAGSEQARVASAALTAAQAALAGEQDRVKYATDGVTQSMLEMAAQIAAAANSDLAYRMSVDATETAISELNAAIAAHGATSEEASDAALQVEQALLQQAAAARQAAFDTSTATSEAGKNAEADAAMLAELLSLQATMGGSFPAALNTTISRLQGTTNAGMVAAAQFSQLGLTILSVPNSKTIIVSSTTPEQIALLESLGFKVTHLPDGTVRVEAQTSAAEAAINQAARDRQSTIYVRTVGGNQTVPGSSIRSTVATGGAIENGRVQHFDIGGGVYGPGGPTSDRVPAMLSNGEHVWTAREVDAAGGQAAVAAMRRAVLSGRESSGGGWGGGSSSVNLGDTVVKVYIDGQEFRGMARVEAQGAAASALNALTDRGRHNG